MQGVSMKKCVLLVDYTRVLINLSYQFELDMSAVLESLRKKATDQYDVQTALLMVNIDTQEADEFYVYYPVPGATTANISQDMIAASDAFESDTYIIVGGQANYVPLLTHLRKRDKEIIFWSVAPAPYAVRYVSNNVETIPLPPTRDAKWPREVMLAAVILILDEIDDSSPILVADAIALLERLTIFRKFSRHWIEVVIGEHLLVRHFVDESWFVSLNRMHPIVKNTFETRDRVMRVIAAMLIDRDWVAFSAVEKSLRSIKLLVGKQRLRQAWIELLIETRLLLTEQIPQLGSPFMTTALLPNAEHPFVSRQEYHQYLALVRLIVVADDFIRLNGYEWISASALLQRLTTLTSRAEARTTLNQALDGSLILRSEIPSPQHPDRLITILVPNYDHESVGDYLIQRDEILYLIDAALYAHDDGLSKESLEQTLHGLRNLEPDEPHFWIELLVQENLLLKNTELGVSAYHLALDHQVVQDARQYIGNKA